MSLWEEHECIYFFFVSFLNVGKQVASSSDNFLVFGASCESESCGVVQNYVKYACKQMKDLEERVFAIGGFHVTFKFKELPNDINKQQQQLYLSLT